MLYFFSIGIIIISVLIGFKFLQRIYINKRVKKKFHYFILVENSQGIIELVIRYIHFRSWLEGKATKITVVDLGSNDDTLAILERLIYPKRKLDRLYNHDSQQLSIMLEESIQKGELPVIFYINSIDNISGIKGLNHLIFSQEDRTSP